jgi:transcriptional regulator with XRE-family HTH domain
VTRTPPDFYDELGRRIAEIRKSRSMSQEQLGERADVGTSHISHIEIGTRRPHLDVLLRIAAALDVPLWRLITDDRMTSDERTWDASSRDLAEKVRGLDADDLAALSYLAARLQRRGVRSLRAAEGGGPRWPRRKRGAAKRR